MRKLALLVVLAVATCAAPAFAQQLVTVKTVTQTLSASAPSTALDGVDISNALGFAVVVSAASGQTISGGSLLCYWYVPFATAGATCSSGTACTYRWARCASGLDFTPRTSVRDAPSLGYEVPVGVSRVHFITSSVTVSSGSTVEVTLVVRRRPQ